MSGSNHAIRTEDEIPDDIFDDLEWSFNVLRHLIHHDMKPEESIADLVKIESKIHTSLEKLRKIYPDAFPVEHD